MKPLLCSMAIVWGIQFANATAAAQTPAETVVELKARGEREGWTFTVSEEAGGGYPWQERCGLVVPKDWRQRAPSRKFAAKAELPAQVDLRPYCTPIRNQGSCGSCWAFATVGTLECVLRLKTQVSVDLSEQWLVSCNQEEEEPGLLEKGAWGCNGGWFAHDYHQWKTDLCDGSGAVLEAHFPYVHADTPCDCPYPHSYWIDGWAYIDTEETIPTVDAIKQALLEYGPISVGVTVNDAFAFYQNGVFNSNSSEEINHAVVLVGWDDTLGTHGVWILRNSWGTSWGLSGYMYIEYGCSSVGLGACYIEYPAAPGLPGPLITVEPYGRLVEEGDSVTFSVAATGVGGLHYQWRKDGVPAGEDDRFLVISNVAFEHAGTYTCEVSDLRGSTVSQPAFLDVRPAGSLPAAIGPGLVLLMAAGSALGIRTLKQR